MYFMFKKVVLALHKQKVLPVKSVHGFSTSQYFFEHTGWGKIKHPGSSHPILQQALLPPVANDVCAKKLAASPGIKKECHTVHKRNRKCEYLALFY